MSRSRLSVICRSNPSDVFGRLQNVLNFSGKLVGPAGLEPATSWFVVGIRKIDRTRPMMTKIPPLNDLTWTA